MPIQNNFDRMVALAEEFFGTRNDPEQIVVTPEVIAQLEKIHPATMGEVREENGPIAWMLVIPTTNELMEGFLSRILTERQLLDQTPVGARYTALYLCSALVLPEHRGKGLSRRLALNAIRNIRQDHPIETLFVWWLSSEGRSLAANVANACGLPLREKETA
jgi:GNAT superfamily N-acetyltransferase